MNIEQLIAKISGPLSKVLVVLRRYQNIIFIVFLALIFSFLFYRINSLSSQQPTDSDVTAQLKAASNPHIDQDVVLKIKQLQDNSVQVNTLFNQARNNPFSE